MLTTESMADNWASWRSRDRFEVADSHSQLTQKPVLGQLFYLFLSLSLGQTKRHAEAAHNYALFYRQMLKGLRYTSCS